MICLNDYLESNVISVTSTGIVYSLKQVKDFDQLGSYTTLMTGGYVKVQAVYDGDWDYVENHITPPEGDFTIADEPHYLNDEETKLESFWLNLGELEPGSYRGIVLIRPSKDDGTPYPGEEYYASFEFEIPEE